MNPLDVVHVLQQILALLQNVFNPIGWLRSAWSGSGHDLLSQLTGFLTSTNGPLSLEGLTRNDTVVHYVTVTRLIADGALAGVLVWAFIGQMWNQSAYGHYRLRLLLPRLLLASVLINFSSPLIQGAIDVNRALSMTVLQAGAFDLGRFFQDVNADLTNGLTPVPLALAVAIAMVLAFVLLLVVYVLRFALIVVLAITAPLAALLFVLHETSEHARQWSALFVTSLFMQPLQLLIIGIGWSLDTHDFGLGPLRHAFALACLVLCFRVPGVLHSSALVGRKGLSTGHSAAKHAWKHVLKAA
ncbi:MAG TPA: hypothetical protein VF137_08580 [Candidatus Dormibacteraeota bacterium]